MVEGYMDKSKGKLHVGILKPNNDPEINSEFFLFFFWVREINSELNLLVVTKKISGGKSSYCCTPPVGFTLSEPTDFVTLRE